MFDEDQADLFHGAVHGRAAAEDHGAGGWPPATPPAHRQPRRLRDGRGGETDNDHKGIKLIALRGLRQSL